MTVRGDTYELPKQTSTIYACSNPFFRSAGLSFERGPPPNFPPALLGVLHGVGVVVGLAVQSGSVALAPGFRQDFGIPPLGAPGFLKEKRYRCIFTYI